MRSRILIVFLFAFLLSGCQRQQNVQVHRLAEGKSDFYYSEESLYHAAETVLIVERTNTDKNVVKLFGNEAFFGYTLAQVKITEIIKDNTDQELVDGQVITVLENQFTHSQEGTEYVYHTDYYNMMIPEKQYVLYLGYSENDQWYYIMTGLEGKIPLDPSEDILFPMTEIVAVENQELSEDAETLKIMETIRETCIMKYK